MQCLFFVFPIQELVDSGIVANVCTGIFDEPSLNVSFFLKIEMEIDHRRFELLVSQLILDIGERCAGEQHVYRARGSITCFYQSGESDIRG